LTIVECKLWKNPQARREVVAQTLHYISALAAGRTPTCSGKSPLPYAIEIT
jgi:hypothetical protein